MPVLRFLGSTPGRAVRVLLGLALIVVGVVAGGGWLALSAVGLVPLAAGVFDVCLLGPIAGLPFRGAAFRSRCADR